MKTKASTLLLFLSFIVQFSKAQIDVEFNIYPDSGQTTISPYIYGCNWTTETNASTEQNFSFIRMGGNRTTSYNWENNASNAGEDWNNASDDYWAEYLDISASDTPGIVATTIIDQAKANDSEALITLQMAGYVAADKNGTVDTTAPSDRWCEVVAAKNADYSLSPDLTDGKVYMDEYVNFLKNTYGSGGVKFALDNEPSLWSTSHPYIHANSTACQELIEKSITLASAVKAVDSSAEVFGFVSYGFNSYRTFQDASDWKSLSGSHNWFLGYYLEKMKEASDSVGERLIDVLDLHWYPEAEGDNRIINSSANTTNDKLARLQAPRTLWDSDYTEDSWIAQYFSSYLPLIPSLQNSIDTYNPGTKLAISEFQYGGYDDITGAIALSDALGIFGKYGVYAAMHWDTPGSYGSLAYQLYRNYDGHNATYGDINVTASMSDKENSSVYASVVSDNEDELHIIALNKSMEDSITGTFNINGSLNNYTSVLVYTIREDAAEITTENDITISGNSFTYVLPALSAFHFIVSKKGEHVSVTGVELTPEIDSISIHGTTQIEAIVSPDNATTKGVNWSSSDPLVATVSSSGLVTGISEGSATIKASTYDGGFSDSSIIFVSSFIPPCEDPVSTSLPLSIEGTGTYCYVTSGNIGYVNSWNAAMVEINGVDYTNIWADTLPDMINGNYYIHYKGTYSWSHLEVNSSEGSSSDAVLMAKTQSTLKNTFGCTQTSENLWLFPNPATDQIEIMLPNDGTGSQSNLKVISNAGKTLISETFTGTSYVLDISGFSNGVYNILINNESALYKGTFIKQ